MRSLLRLIPYFKRYRRSFLFGVFAILLSTIFMVITPVLIREAIDGLQENFSRAALFRYAALILLVSALSGIFLYVQRQTIIVASRKIECDLRNDFFKHIERLSMRFFQNTTTGEIMAHSTNDIGAVRMFVGPAVMYSTETVFTFVIVIALLISIHPLLTLYSLLPLPLVSYAVHRLGNVIHRRFEDIQNHYSILTSRANENLSGIRVVKSYLREEYEISRFKALSEEYLEKNMKMAKVQALLMPLLMLLIGVSVTIVVWYGGVQVIDRSLTLGEFTQFMIYIMMMIWPMIAIGWVVSLIQRSAASMKRIERILEQKPEIADHIDADYSISRINGSIEFENVTFRYTESGENILDAISLDIPCGTTLAVIGYTGAGKTTFVNLVPRLYDTVSGVVKIDGHDIVNIPLETIRKHIAYVTQETFLFSDTLKANISFGVDNPSKDRIEWAAKIAQIEKDIVDFPDGYDTVIGERGITLSGGQKQRISLARALLRDPAILILDDALSAVDTHTEEDILTRLKEVMRERTSIIISHRISTVKHADRIITIHEGKIAESGTHEELVALGGIYAELYHKQLLAEELEEIE